MIFRLDSVSYPVEQRSIPGFSSLTPWGGRLYGAPRKRREFGRQGESGALWR